MSRDINFTLVDPSKGIVNYTINDDKYTLYYPCFDSFNCTPYKTHLKAGTYFVELYGASGGSPYPTTPFRNVKNEFLDPDIVDFYGGNVKPLNKGSLGGSGGYTSGNLIIPNDCDIYIRIGGEGEAKKGTTKDTKETEADDQRPRGGYNGGGRGTSWNNTLTFGGGGATDLRARNDTVFHRVMVAGAGAGPDDPTGEAMGQHNDGTGGSGGGLIAQGFWANGVYESSYLATQTSGFAFGQGESSLFGPSKHPKGSKINYGSSDRPGAGGGWFGGFAGQHGNGGSGGGSSFALTENAKYPRGLITLYDDLYEKIGEGYYAFTKHEYLVTNAVFEAGIWYGDGKVTITPISLDNKICIKRFTCHCRRLARMNFVTTLIAFIFLY